MCINKLIPPPLSRSLSIIPALPPQQASVHRAAAKFREAACVRVAKFTRAAFKYAMRSREERERSTTGVRCRITTAAAATRPRQQPARHRFRIQSAEFMRASQLDTRPVLFHGNVITRGIEADTSYSCVYNRRGLIRLTGCPCEPTTARGYVCNLKRLDMASSIIEPRPFTGKYVASMGGYLDDLLYELLERLLLLEDVM